MNFALRTRHQALETARPVGVLLAGLRDVPCRWLTVTSRLCAFGCMVSQIITLAVVDCSINNTNHCKVIAGGGEGHHKKYQGISGSMVILGFDCVSYSL